MYMHVVKVTVTVTVLPRPNLDIEHLYTNRAYVCMTILVCMYIFHDKSRSLVKL